MSMQQGPQQFAFQRASLGIGLRELARQLGISASTLSHWERSDRPLPAEKELRWRLALSVCATQRAMRLLRAGANYDDLATSDIGRAGMAFAPFTFSTTRETTS